MKTPLWIAIVALLFGVILLILSFFLGEHSGSHFHPFASFLLGQFGALLAFSATYTFISEFFLKREFVTTLESRMDLAVGNAQIMHFGLANVFESWSDERLLARIRSAKKVIMYVMRSDHFFRANCATLRDRIDSGDLTLSVVLPDPKDEDLMKVLKKRYSDKRTPKELATSISTVVEVWLNAEIKNHLKPENQGRLQILFFGEFPLYSAYLFDDAELWYVPYPQRKDWHPIPIFVFRESLSKLELYRDFQEVVALSKQDPSIGT